MVVRLLPGLINRLRMLIIGVVVVALGALVVGAGSWLLSERARALETGERSAQSLARLLEEQTVRNIEAIDLTLMGIIDALRSNPDIEQHDAALEASLRQRLQRIPYVRALFIVDANGLVTQNSNGPDTLSIDLSDRPIDLSDRAYFKAHAIDPDPSLRIGEPLISRALGTWFISLTRRIDNPDGSFGGIVVASIDPTYIQTFYRELKFGADDSINLFLRDGTLLARIPQPEQVIGLNFSSLDLFRTQLRSSQAGVYRAPSMITGTPRIIGYRAPDEYPIVVSVALGENEILAQWKSHLFSTIVAIGLVSTLVILLALFWLRRLREREEALRHVIQVQKLEALGQMTGTAAHDFNNLMGVVSGGIRLARRKIKDAEALHLLDTVADAVQRGTKITQQMLAFASQQKLDVVESNVNELLINLKELLCRAAGSHVAIVYDLADDVPRCMTDRTQFDTAVINLVINARDAMPDAGVIRISTSRFLGEERKLTGRIRAGPCACVTVTDNGQGMSPDVQRRALEPFFTTKGEKGTGLGLSQVYGFVRQNGGDMIIESEAGKGTSIHLLFPGIEDRSSLPPQGERQYTREAMQQPIGEMSAVLHQVAIRGSLSRRPTIALQMRPRHRETIA